ncbi:heterokaryon incompatibility [Fusarium beomiforme]|uniref:Heterokaryon incompatibility n=1 Tax=Fusarium beomiforme TaxID=44412 RepID=A0A9P5DRD4_9HYPO|nr:heterokaryon incompatibility [Fusarium beomiforme]
MRHNHMASQTESIHDQLLEDRQIRLLKIISADPNIECTLEVVSLWDHPTYSALSYVWGDPKQTEEITVNRQTIAVGSALAAALRDIPQQRASFPLHYPDGRAEGEEGSSERFLWADAICINQENASEKGH